MKRYTLLLLLLLPALVTFAQKKNRKPAIRFTRPVLKEEVIREDSRQRSPRKTDRKVSPGAALSFRDLLLLLPPGKNAERLLVQKKFKTGDKIEDPYKEDTVTYRNPTGDNLLFFYHPDNREQDAGILFHTLSEKLAMRLLAEAAKEGFLAADSMEIAAGNGVQSYLSQQVQYRLPPPEMAYEMPPSPFDEEATEPAFTFTREPWPGGGFLFFLRQQRSLYGLTGPKTLSAPPKDYFENGLPVAWTDTVVIPAGKPVLVFTDISYIPYNETAGQRDRDSIRFFDTKRKADEWRVIRDMKELYPPELYRYIYVYTASVLQFGNDRSEQLLYNKQLHGATNFTYWSGTVKDKIITYDSWHGAPYVVANARGDNRLLPGYAGFREDSIRVDRLLQMPAGQSSPGLREQLAYFILSALHEDYYLPLPLLNLQHTQRILITSADRNLLYHFNGEGQLSSVQEQSGGTGPISQPRNVISISYQNGLPDLVCKGGDTSRLRYAGDTLIVERFGHLRLFRLTGKMLLPTDDFDLGSNDYLRNDIRDDYFTATLQEGKACLSKYIDREKSRRFYTKCFSNAWWQLPLTLTDDSRSVMNDQGQFMPLQSYKQEASGALLITDDQGSPRERKTRYYFHNEQLQQIEIDNPELQPAHQVSHVFITNYNQD